MRLLRVSPLVLMGLLAGCLRPHVDPKDGLPVLVGAATREAILAHREVYRSRAAAAQVPESLKARWRGIRTPSVLVVAFGSWCGDTQRELPDLLALLADPNPFVRVAFIGVARDKVAPPEAWPPDLAPERVLKVPTLWLYTLQPGGRLQKAGSIVENPPRAGQSMAEALVELLEGTR